ncbi:glycine cleavage system protein t [Lichtheimia corymbifera JMRC:FSU:9682]|uniref:Aminomethyltransferase n=1 Tax=Lichtheimia corymbifera JMRC:FSU:9682 TaxID=1263082 RepID=A0A068SGV4_9FUNG|nr:glycine cleavage system protein t [Lichtheimia corymbifera JMRC:FSU:9682]
MLATRLHRAPQSLLSIATRSVSQRFYAAAAGEEKLKKTALYDFHVEQGGKMVPFAGYSMPVQYKNMGQLASHLHTREKASIFDVSHMLQTRVVGKDRKKFFETLVVADLHQLPVGQGTLSLFTNEQGGIIDDTIIMQQDDCLYVVSNAACADSDLAHIRKHLADFQNKGGDVDLQVIDDHSLVAIQGPSAAAALQELVGKDLNDFGFMHGKFMDLAGIPCHVARSGYTGEDGFELSVPTPEVVDITKKLLAYPGVEMAGLGARDSLRLEAGLCLYGNDIDATTTPIEGGLTWTIPKSRRETGGFLGADKILAQIKDKSLIKRRRVGLIVQGAPAREGAEILDKEGNVIGNITSGCPSPCLKKNIAIGYVKSGFQKKGTELSVKVRNRVQDAVITKMPFVEAKYHK